MTASSEHVTDLRRRWKLCQPWDLSPLIAMAWQSRWARLTFVDDDDSDDQHACPCSIQNGAAPLPNCTWCRGSGRTSWDLTRCSCTKAHVESPADPKCPTCKGSANNEGERCGCAFTEEDLYAQADCEDCGGTGARPWGL